MKKAGIVLSLSILIALLTYSVSFAEGLELTGSYPKDGSHDARPETLAVKLYFNEDVSSIENIDGSSELFQFVDSEGKELPIIPLYDSKRPNEIWIHVDETLASDSEYSLFISGNLTTASGDTLGEDRYITLRTRNLSTDSRVNMIMMGVMIAGMFVYTLLSTRRQLKKQEAAAQADDKVKVNPYKVAKETGKSVEDIVAKTEKARAKARAKAQAEQTAMEAAEESANDKADSGKDTKRVKGPRPIAAAGSTYVTGRKALAEKAAAEQAKSAARQGKSGARPKNSGSRGRRAKAKK